MPAFSRVISRRRIQEEAEQAVEKLYALLPRQQIAAKIQAKLLVKLSLLEHYQDLERMLRNICTVATLLVK